jgi:hypothetical protein
LLGFSGEAQFRGEGAPAISLLRVNHGLMFSLLSASIKE